MTSLSQAQATSLLPPPQPSVRSRTNSNPWTQYSDFFTNSSFLIPDTVAFAKILPYFKALPNYSLRFNIQLVELVGYEAYFVEQWISSRSSNNLIVTYTGDKKDRLIVYHVQSLSTHMQLQPAPQIHEQSRSSSHKIQQLSQSQQSQSQSQSQSQQQHLTYDNWPPKFISYLVEQLESPFCVATETSLGYAFITNLTQLNPFLSLIDSKTGNILEDYNCYVVNYNLRKLGCGSRSAATTDLPTKSMEDKFKTTFKIDSKILINYASIDLLLITQTFLYYYGLLDALYCDGLFCDKTDIAIKEWWKLISEIPMASHIIKIKPPTSHSADSIQAIIGFTILCRYLLELGGNTFNVSKDPMDVKKFKSSVIKFQKHHKLDPTSKLNLETLLKLIEWGQNNKVSQNLTKDLSKMKDLVKNTVIDITSGKNLQMIAHNATASPFYLHSYSSYDQTKFINCQNIDNIKHMSLGKQLSYLFFSNGKPIDLYKDSLSVLANKKIADSTINSSIMDGVKRLKNQLSLQSFQQKNHKKSSRSIGSNYDQDYYDNEVFHEDLDIDEVLSDDYNEQIHKKKKRSPSSLFFSSEDESPQEKSDSNNNRSTSLADFDYDDYNNDVAIYNPSKIINKNNNISKANSLSATSYNSDHGNLNGYDHYADYDGDFTNNYYNTGNDHNRGTSFSSQKNSKKIDINNLDEALIDDDIFDSEYYHNHRSNNNSRRNTDFHLKNSSNGNKDLKSFYSPPHMISSGDLSGQASRVNSVNNKFKNDNSINNNNKHISRNSRGSNYLVNDIDSDGVYEYENENGFEYDYELDPNYNHQSQSQSQSQGNKQLKEHSRRASSLDNNNIGQVRTAFSTQTNLVSLNGREINYKCGEQHPNIDYDYMNFMKRIKRRHSIPLVESELNKYSIEMKMKKDKIDTLLNNNIKRNHSWGNRRKIIWDHTNINNSKENDLNDENNENDLDSKNEFNNINDQNDQNSNSFLYRMECKQNVFGAQSIKTNNSNKSNYISMASFIIYHKSRQFGKVRRSQSFSVVEHSLGIASKEYGFKFTTDIGLITSEVLAMRYLKLEAEYQIEMIQGSFNLTKDLQNYSRFLLDSINSEKNPSTCVSVKYGSTRGDVKKVVGKYFELEDKLKNTVKSNARLKYELRLLLQRTKEVENNLKTLQDFKIKTLSTKIDNMVSELTKFGKVGLESEVKEIVGDMEDSADYVSTSKSKKDDSDISILDKLYASGGTIDWSKLSLTNILQNPYVLVYLFFHLFLCVILKRVDAKMVEERWKEIDKNQTVTMIIRKLYSKGETNVMKKDLVPDKVETVEDIFQENEDRKKGI